MGHFTVKRLVRILISNTIAGLFFTAGCVVFLNPVDTKVLFIVVLMYGIIGDIAVILADWLWPKNSGRKFSDMRRGINIPIPPKIYRHIKYGNFYELVYDYVTDKTSTHIPKRMVCYKDCNNGRLYVREYNEFNQKFLHVPHKPINE